MLFKRKKDEAEFLEKFGELCRTVAALETDRVIRAVSRIDAVEKGLREVPTVQERPGGELVVERFKLEGPVAFVTEISVSRDGAVVVRYSKKAAR